MPPIPAHSMTRRDLRTAEREYRNAAVLARHAPRVVYVSRTRTRTRTRFPFAVVAVTAAAVTACAAVILAIII